MFNLFAWMRRRIRRADAKFLWPAFYEASNGCGKMFAAMTGGHMATDPAWRYEHEWLDTPEDPDVWFDDVSSLRKFVHKIDN